MVWLCIFSKYAYLGMTRLCILPKYSIFMSILHISWSYHTVLEYWSTGVLQVPRITYKYRTTSTTILILLMDDVWVLSIRTRCAHSTYAHHTCAHSTKSRLRCIIWLVIHCGQVSFCSRIPFDPEESVQAEDLGCKGIAGDYRISCVIRAIKLCLTSSPCSSNASIQHERMLSRTRDLEGLFAVWVSVTDYSCPTAAGNPLLNKIMGRTFFTVSDKAFDKETDPCRVYYDGVASEGIILWCIGFMEPLLLMDRQYPGKTFPMERGSRF